jgi:hypothetical protein
MGEQVKYRIRERNIMVSRVLQIPQLTVVRKWIFAKLKDYEYERYPNDSDFSRSFDLWRISEYVAARMKKFSDL